MPHEINLEMHRLRAFLEWWKPVWSFLTCQMSVMAAGILLVRSRMEENLLCILQICGLLFEVTQYSLKSPSIFTSIKTQHISPKVFVFNLHRRSHLALSSQGLTCTCLLSLCCLFRNRSNTALRHQHVKLQSECTCSSARKPWGCLISLNTPELDLMVH